jgi:hypothetical protein
MIRFVWHVTPESVPLARSALEKTTLDEMLGCEPDFFREDRFEPPDAFTGEERGSANEPEGYFLSHLAQSCRRALERSLSMQRPEAMPESMAEESARILANIRAEQATRRVMEAAWDRRIRLCFVVCRRSLIRADRRLGADRRFHVIPRPTLRTWLNRRMIDLRVAAYEALEALRLELAAGPVVRKSLFRSLLSILDAIVALRDGEDPAASRAGIGPILRDLVAELLSPQIRAAGGQTSAFVPLA